MQLSLAHILQLINDSDLRSKIYALISTSEREQANQDILAIMDNRQHAPSITTRIEET